MIRALFVAAMLAARACVAQQAKPDSLPPIRFVTMDDYVREILAKDWDAHAKDWPIFERGYCLGYQLDFFAGELAYRVTQISLPDSAVATVAGINFSCVGKFPGHLAELHIHPPTSCKSADGPCFPGGTYSYQCKESDSDTWWLRRTGKPFSMIQCSREGIVYWFPHRLSNEP